MFNGTFREFVRRHTVTLLPFLTPMKTLNVMGAMIEFWGGKASLRSRPFIYRVDPSSACNLRCPGCEAHTQPTDERRLLPLHTFDQILPAIKRFGIRLSLYDSGEPLVNADVFEMVSRGRKAGLATMINSNMTLFRDHHLPQMEQSELTVLSASVDGYTQEDYSQYRKRGQIKHVLQALRSIVALKKKTGKGPFLEIQVIDFKHLRDKKAEIIEFFNDLGVDRVVWKRESWGFNGEEPNAPAGNRCFWLYTGAMIRPDGKLYPCSGRGFSRLPYGDLTKQSIDEIWNNRIYRFSRKLFTAGPDLPYSKEMKDVPCLTCTHFQKKRVMRARHDSREKLAVVQIA